MELTPQTAWLIAISAVVIVGIIAFFIGRKTAGTRERIDALEAELDRKQQEVAGYRKEVEAHFDKTATLFVSMAGSYKELFEHLSTDYEKLSTGSARELFQQRVDALLIANARAADKDAAKLLGGAAAAGAAATAAEGEGDQTASTTGEAAAVQGEEAAAGAAQASVAAAADAGSPTEAAAEAVQTDAGAAGQSASGQAPAEDVAAEADAGEAAKGAAGAPAEATAQAQHEEASREARRARASPWRLIVRASRR